MSLNTNNVTQHLFKDKSESYKHYYAKLVLKNWLHVNYLAVRIEEKFITNFGIRIPDLSCYTENGISSVYEIVNKSPVTDEKKWFYIQYMRYLKVQFPVYEVDSNWVLSQINKPKRILKTRIL